MPFEFHTIVFGFEQECAVPTAPTISIKFMLYKHKLSCFNFPIIVNFRWLHKITDFSCACYHWKKNQIVLRLENYLTVERDWAVFSLSFLHLNIAYRQGCVYVRCLVLRSRIEEFLLCGNHSISLRSAPGIYVGV